MATVAWTGRWTWEASDDEELHTSSRSSCSSRKRVARSRAGVLPARFRDSSFELPLHHVQDGGNARLQATFKKRLKCETKLLSPPTMTPSTPPTKINIKLKPKPSVDKRSTSATSSRTSKPRALYSIKHDFIYASLEADDEDDGSSDNYTPLEASSIDEDDVELPSESKIFERSQSSASVSARSSGLTPEMAASWLRAFSSDVVLCMFAADGQPRKVVTLESTSFAERVRRAKSRCDWASEHNKSVHWLRSRTLDMRNVYIVIRDQLSPLGARTATCIWPQDSPDRTLLEQLVQLHSAPWWSRWHDDVASKYRNLQVASGEGFASRSSEAPMSSAYAALVQISGTQATASTSASTLSASPPAQIKDSGSPISPEAQALNEARRQRFLSKQAELNRQLQLELELLRTHYETQRSAIEQEYAADSEQPQLQLAPGSSEDLAMQDTTCWSTASGSSDSMDTSVSSTSHGAEMHGCASSYTIEQTRRSPELQQDCPVGFETWLEVDNDDVAAASQAEASASVVASQSAYLIEDAETSSLDLVDMARRIATAHVPVSAAPRSAANESLEGAQVHELDLFKSLQQTAELAEHLTDDGARANAEQQVTSFAETLATAAVAAPQTSLDPQELDLGGLSSSQEVSLLTELRFGTDTSFGTPSSRPRIDDDEENEGDLTESQLAVMSLLKELSRGNGESANTEEVVAGHSTASGRNVAPLTPTQ